MGAGRADRFFNLSLSRLPTDIVHFFSLDDLREPSSSSSGP